MVHLIVKCLEEANMATRRKTTIYTPHTSSGLWEVAGGFKTMSYFGAFRWLMPW